MKFRQLISMLILWLLIPGHTLAVDIAIYAQLNLKTDPRNEYPVQLLELALKNSGEPIALEASVENLHQGQAMRMIQNNNGVDVVWTMTSQLREKILLPIKIPIYKGLIGWRLCIIHPQNKSIFASVKSLSGLSDVTFVQGHDWPDTNIFKFNRLSVTSVSNYQAMFDMVLFRRVDAFPRAVIEIWPELESHKDLQVDSHLLIRYPAAVYYFVNRKNQKLYNAIMIGLNKAIINGDFNRLFNNFYLNAIQRAKLNKRRVINLINPLLPKNTPLDKQQLWYRSSFLDDDE
ncbi:substrate-binding periplasmic protein [Zooshikella sp. RANM57]|uniref:substrate-binding periplasmic protein n=1 Tax=Zooshikella sp. RANM57 TaxID=3425863 RepID=UPI003D6E838C